MMLVNPVVALLATLLLQSPDNAPISLASLGGARPWTEIANGCVPFADKKAKEDFDIRECESIGSGRVGAVDGRRYDYVFYCLLENRDLAQAKCGKSETPRGVAIFVSDEGSNTARLLLARTGFPLSETMVSAPELITNRFGTFLQLNVVGWRSNLSEYYRWLPTKGEWHRIDFSGDHLKAQLERRVPRGMEWNSCAMSANLSSMMAVTFLKRPSDPICSGGRLRVDIRMTIRNDRFEVESANFGESARKRP